MGRKPTSNSLFVFPIKIIVAEPLLGKAIGNLYMQNLLQTILHGLLHG